MLGGLYGDLPEAKDSNGKAMSSKSDSGWAAPKLHVPAKRGAPAVPPSLLRAGRGRGRGAERGDAGGGRGSGGGGLAASAAEPAAVSFLSVNGVALRDEYDPARPNDYAAIREARENARREAEREAERQEAMRRAERALQDAHPEEARGPASDSDAAAAVLASAAAPVAASTGEEAFLRRARLSKGGAAAQEEEAKGMGLAAKMMQKMGWRGGGLGREQQGIATPLVAQKSGGRSGIIVQGEDSRPKGTNIEGRPSKVILLRNMVGPGQVDPDLEEEVGNECNSKYGGVTGVVIFEVTEPNFPAEQAVRIFVAFDRQESAIKAAVDLGGRFFGGRQVRASFYSEDRYSSGDFAPDPAKGD